MNRGKENSKTPQHVSPYFATYKCINRVIKLLLPKQMQALSLAHLTTIADPWYFWKGSCTSKAHKPVTLSGNATFTKV